MPSVILGNDIASGQKVRIGDIERRSGLYVLGNPGMGKSSLLVNMMLQDWENGNRIFFLDPHGDAISDFLKRTSVRPSRVHLFNPADKDYSFSMNLLHCNDITNLTEATDTYTRAYNVFYKLWEDSWGPWLQLILQNVLWAFIENPQFRLTEIPWLFRYVISASRHADFSPIPHESTSYSKAYEHVPSIVGEKGRVHRRCVTPARRAAPWPPSSQPCQTPQ